jgi:hypothetical protein
MQDERIEALVKVFNTSRRSEIDAAWVIADSMGDEVLTLFAEAFPRIRKSEGRASIMRYVGRFSRESELAFRMGTVAVQDRAYAVRRRVASEKRIMAVGLRQCIRPIVESMTPGHDG